MRGYFAIIDNKPYELEKLSLSQASQILGEEANHIEVSTLPAEKHLIVDMTVSDLSKKTYTNKANAEMFKEFLRETKTESITKLSKYYTVYIEYILADESCGEVVDHGIGVKSVNPRTFLFPLGITDENEYVARMGMELAVKCTKAYRPRNPYGVMRAPQHHHKYSLVINRVWVTAILDRAWSLSPSATKPNPNNYTGGCHKPYVATGYEHKKEWGLPYGMCADNDDLGALHIHPSFADASYMPLDRVTNPNDIVTIYDSADCGTTVYSTSVDFPPELVTLCLDVKSLLPILISKEEIEELLESIKTTIDDENGTDNGDDTGSDTDDGDTPLDGDDGDVENPGEEGTGSNEGTGDTGSDNNGTDNGDDTPLNGDDGDVETPGEETGNTGGSEGGDTGSGTGSDEGTEEGTNEGSDGGTDNGETGNTDDGGTNEGTEPGTDDGAETDANN